MGSMLGDWPSFDPHNFGQLRPSDPSNSCKLIPATCHPTHGHTFPPPDQAETKESCLRTSNTRAWMQATWGFYLALKCMQAARAFYLTSVFRLYLEI